VSGLDIDIKTIGTREKEEKMGNLEGV